MDLVQLILRPIITVNPLTGQQDQQETNGPQRKRCPITGEEEMGVKAVKEAKHCPRCEILKINKVYLLLRTNCVQPYEQRPKQSLDSLRTTGEYLGITGGRWRIQSNFSN
jgi:hypothetical protein